MGPICFVWLGGIFLTVTPANAAELDRLEDVIGKPLKTLKTAIKEISRRGDYLLNATKSSLLAKLRRSEIFIDTVPKKRAQLR
jgi:hypothetical protein